MPAAAARSPSLRDNLPYDAAGCAASYFWLGEFHHFGLPLLVGMSRKSMVGQLLNVGPSERLNGSLACAVIAAMQGAQIIRVHDVKETVEALRVVEATLAAKGKKRYE